MTGTDVSRIPVAIVGGGPVGLMLALFLDLHGVRSVLFNTEETTRWHPKGSTQNARTMEHYRRLGISGAIRTLGLPADHPTDVVYFTRFGGRELARLKMPSSAETLAARARAARTDQTPEPLHRANQMYVEDFLLAHIRTRPNITLRFGWRVERFADDGAGVTLAALRGRDGARETWRSGYLVGCDGGQGEVRRTLGIRFAGQSLRQPYMGGSMFSTYVKVPALKRDFLRGTAASSTGSSIRNCVRPSPPSMATTNSCSGRARKAMPPRPTTPRSSKPCGGRRSPISPSR